MLPPARLIRSLLVFDIEWYAQEVPGGSETSHLHPFWQMDVYLSGWTEVWTEDGRASYGEPGMTVLFPPLTWHTYAIAAHHRRATLKLTLVPGVWPVAERRPLVTRLEDPLLAVLRSAETWLEGRSGLQEAEAMALAELCVAQALHSLPPPEPVLAGPDPFTDRLAHVLDAVARQPYARWSVAEMARACAMTPDHFTRRCRALLGQAPQQYVLETRLQAAATELLADPDLAIKHVAERAGYGSVHAFTRAFARLLGAPPAAFRRSQGRT